MNQQTIQRLRDIFGSGAITKYQALNSDYRKTYTLWLTQKSAGEVLTAILPYLVTKVNEAKLALEFLELPRATPGNRLPSEWIEEREHYFVALRDAKVPLTYIS